MNDYYSRNRRLSLVAIDKDIHAFWIYGIDLILHALELLTDEEALTFEQDYRTRSFK